MPRIARGIGDGLTYHVLNRGNGRQQVFHKEHDYRAFIELMGEAKDRYPVKIFAYCLMPNHFHLVLQPTHGDDLSKWMQWLMTSHIRRYHGHYGTCGHVWQGRYKSFVIQNDSHFLTVLRYVENNPVRAGLVTAAKDWAWSSHRARISRLQDIEPPNRRSQNSSLQINEPRSQQSRPQIKTQINRSQNNQGLFGHNRVHSGKTHHILFLDELPFALPDDWADQVTKPLKNQELEKLRQSIERQAPFGDAEWQMKIAKEFGLESTIRPRGRPRKDMRAAYEKQL
ncbi:MAG: transposase [Firmicutes bacterium]|nr:transposase [Bacillota bacterium]